MSRYLLIVALLAAAVLVRFFPGSQPTNENTPSRQPTDAEKRIGLDGDQLVSVVTHSEGREPPAEPGLVPIATAGVRKLPHPDFGLHANETAMRVSFEKFIISGAGLSPDDPDSLEQWRNQWCRWGDGNKIEVVPPLSELLQTTPTAGQSKRIEALLAMHDESIRIVADAAALEFRRCVEEIAYGDLVRVPRGETYERSVPGPNEEKNHYSQFSMIDEGDWTYILDLQSRNHPSLHSIFADIFSLRRERSAALQNLAQEIDLENGFTGPPDR